MKKVNKKQIKRGKNEEVMNKSRMCDVRCEHLMSYAEPYTPNPHATEYIIQYSQSHQRHSVEKSVDNFSDKLYIHSTLKSVEFTIVFYITPSLSTAINILDSYIAVCIESNS